MSGRLSARLLPPQFPNSLGTLQGWGEEGGKRGPLTFRFSPGSFWEAHPTYHPAQAPAPGLASSFALLPKSCSLPSNFGLWIWEIQRTGRKCRRERWARRHLTGVNLGGAFWCAPTTLPRCPGEQRPAGLPARSISPW